MRDVINLNRGWYFTTAYDDKFISNDYGEHEWQFVNLPHTNKELPYNYFDEKNYQFISTYRKSLNISSDKKGKRIFIDFDGVMTYAKVYLNGTYVGSNKGGYTPFSCDITEVVKFDQVNQLVVKVDSRELPDIPPFGNVVDYLCYGGIYRDVSLRIVSPIYIDNIFAKPQNVLSDSKQVAVSVFVVNSLNQDCTIKIQACLRAKEAVIADITKVFQLDQFGSSTHDLIITDITDVKLWDLDNPNLYDLEVTILNEGQVLDNGQTRIGFREAVVKADGFYLNDQAVKIRGLNRHQSWPYVGYAMPKRVQRRDADILKYELHLNTVRTSHYPQSKHFLDRCDEIGLLVIEEIPGWQHIGDADWQQIACDNLRAMIQRDWNHPSIFLWGVRINESPDNHQFYTKTNAIARKLDPTRQTCGIRGHRNSEFLEDVYTMNDFIHSGRELVLQDQKRVTGQNYHVPYIVTEYNGHMYPTKRFDHEERIMEHSLRHMRVISAAGADLHIAGAVGWCAFDYNTHYEFGSGDRICYHGVMDMFRIPKFAAYAYSSQVNPAKEVVLKPVTLWARGERSIGGVFPLVIFTNCDSVEMKVDGESIGHYYPDYENFPGASYPPVVIKNAPAIFGEWGCRWFDGEFIGYIGSKPAAVSRFVRNPIPSKLEITADDYQLKPDGQDATRVVFRIVDQVGNLLPYINDFIQISLEGPGKIIGPEQTAFIGGSIASWVKAGEKTGAIRLKAKSSRLASEQIEILVK